MKKLLLIAAAVVVTASASPVFAAGGKSLKPSRVAANACISRDACVTRAMSHGWSSVQGGNWCERNAPNAANGCYK